MSKVSEAEERVAEWLDEAGYPYTRQWRFHPTRRWRFDFALGHPPAPHGDSKTIDQLKLAIEVEGGQFIGGHKRGAAADTDYDKFNEAALRGWTVLRFSTHQVVSGQAWPVIYRAWALRAHPPSRVEK